jgi:hypothetical protein
VWYHSLNVHAPTENQINVMKYRLYKELECVFDKFSKYHMNILLDFNAKVGREDFFTPTIGNESLHEISNDNRVRVLVTVVERSKACTVFTCSEAWIVGLNPTQGMDVWCLCVYVHFSVFVLRRAESYQMSKI